MTNGTGGGSGSGGGSSAQTTRPKGPAEIEFGDNISEARQRNAQFMVRDIPERHMVRLKEAGVKISVDDRADTSPYWDEYSKRTNSNSNTKTADGRNIGDLSFYHRGYVFISDSKSTGSVNVYTHEIGHAIDFNHHPRAVKFEYPPGSGTIRTYHTVSDDPEFVDLHSTRIFPNTHVRAYYRKGSEGSKTSGREESFAEGYAEYLARGRDGVRDLLGSYAVADRFIAILKRNGVID